MKHLNPPIYIRFTKMNRNLRHFRAIYKNLHNSLRKVCSAPGPAPIIKQLVAPTVTQTVGAGAWEHLCLRSLCSHFRATEEGDEQWEGGNGTVCPCGAGKTDRLHPLVPLARACRLTRRLGTGLPTLVFPEGVGDALEWGGGGLGPKIVCTKKGPTRCSSR